MHIFKMKNVKKVRSYDKFVKCKTTNIMASEQIYIKVKKKDLVWSLKMQLLQLIRLHQIPQTEPGPFQPTIATVWKRILMEKIDFYDKHCLI